METNHVVHTEIVKWKPMICVFVFCSCVYFSYLILPSQRGFDFAPQNRPPDNELKRDGGQWSLMFQITFYETIDCPFYLIRRNQYRRYTIPPH